MFHFCSFGKAVLAVPDRPAPAVLLRPRIVTLHVLVLAGWIIFQDNNAIIWSERITTLSNSMCWPTTFIFSPQWNPGLEPGVRKVLNKSLSWLRLLLRELLHFGDG